MLWSGGSGWRIFPSCQYTACRLCTLDGVTYARLFSCIENQSHADCVSSGFLREPYELLQRPTPFVHSLSRPTTQKKEGNLICTSDEEFLATLPTLFSNMDRDSGIWTRFALKARLPARHVAAKKAVELDRFAESAANASSPSPRAKRGVRAH